MKFTAKPKEELRCERCALIMLGSQVLTEASLPGNARKSLGLDITWYKENIYIYIKYNERERGKEVFCVTFLVGKFTVTS